MLADYQKTPFEYRAIAEAEMRSKYESIDISRHLESYEKNPQEYLPHRKHEIDFN